MIQRVEEFGAKFQARAIRPRRDGKLLEEREIQVGLVCPTHDPDSGIPERRCPVVVADDRELRRNTALVEVIFEAASERSRLAWSAPRTIPIPEFPNVVALLSSPTIGNCDVIQLLLK